MKQVDDEAVKQSLQWCSNEVERPNELVCSARLFRSWLGGAAELPYPGHNQWPQTLGLIDVDAVPGDNLFEVRYNLSVVVDILEGLSD